jgi:hypothetical protein
MGNIRTERESMEQPPESSPVVPVELGLSLEALGEQPAFFPVRPLRPIGAIQCAVLNRLAEMTRLDVVSRIKIGNRARNL